MKSKERIGRPAAGMRLVLRRLAAIVFATGAVGLTTTLVGCTAKPEKKNPRPRAAKAPSQVERKIPEPEQIGWLTVRLENPPPDSLLAVKLEDLPAHVKSLYRLRPDRRFLYAAAELQRLNTGSPRQGILGLRFEEERWHLSLDGSPLGDLSEFPTFSDAKSLLLSELRALPAFQGTAAAKGTRPAEPLGAADRAVLESGLAADLFPLFARLNAAWTASPGDPALAEAAVRGLLWLSLQSYDELELSDPILGKALALLAIAEARNPGHLTHEECLLAYLLGYEDHAKVLARRFPGDDPMHLVVNWDLPGLRALVQRRAEPRTEYLYLLLRAESQTNEEAWFHELEASSWGRRIDGPSLRLLLTFSPFRWRTSPASLMEFRVLEDLPTASHVAAGLASAKGPTWSEIATQWLEALRESGVKTPESRLSEFEQAVNSEASRLDGPLFDQQIFRAFRLANFYSSIHAEARYLFDRLGSTDDAEQLGKSLANPPAGTAAELKDWILHRVHLRRSSEGVKAVAADLSGMRHIGVDPLSRISYSVSISVASGVDLTRRAPARGYFERLDMRPSNLHAAARTASELLDDLAIKEQCWRLAVERSPREVSWDLPWALRFLGDRARLRALARDKTWSSAIRSSAVQELASLEGTEPRVLIDEFREILREDPTASRPLEAAVSVLEKQDQIENALQLIDEWLKTYPEKDLTWAAITSLKSRLLRKRGRFREAWEFAQAAAVTYKAGCLEEAALALIDLGRLDQALETAKAMLDRYEGDDSSALVARLLWMKGKDDEAAKLVTSPQRRLTGRAWSWWLPMAFREAFKKTDDARAEAAFLKLTVPSNSTLNIVWFIECLTKNGRADLAVKLCERLQGKGPAGWLTVANYRALRESRGAAPARDWLRAKSTPADLDVFAKQALVDGDCELVWDLPDHPNPTKNDILNLVRAVCLLYQPNAPPERRAQLIKYFESRPKEDFPYYGRFLLGQIDRSMLFMLIRDPTTLCSTGWILGVTSAHECRYEEANSWLQVSMESSANIPPRTWAYVILTRWNGERSVLAELERRGVY